MNDRQNFVRLVEALTPWVSQLVFVGGWAHRLYRLRPEASAPVYQPLVTLDADVAFRDRERMEGSIKARLQEAGFEEELKGSDHPPVSQYNLGADEGSGFYAEFLTPLIGRPTTRDGTPIATLSKAGITAQRLRYLELLLASPWTVTLDAEWGAKSPLTVLVPNPVSFIVQKLLIHGDRPTAKKAQDILYIHDTLELFGSDLEGLSSIWRDDVGKVLHPRWLTAMNGTRGRLFGEMNDHIRNAAVIPQDRQLDPERLRQMCAAALTQVIG